MSDEAKKTLKTITLKKLKPESYRFWVSAASTTLQVHNCLDIVLGRKPKPAPADENASLTPTLRTSISGREIRHSLAREALLNALEDPELVKVYQSPTAQDIWKRLSEEYGTVSDLMYARAEAALRSLVKLLTTAVKNHIEVFTRLKEERDISAPENITPLDTVRTNLAILTSLGEPWKLFHQALGDSAQTVKTGELFAEVLAMVDTTTPSQPSGTSATSPPPVAHTKYDNKPASPKKTVCQISAQQALRKDEMLLPQRTTSYHRGMLCLGRRRCWHRRLVKLIMAHVVCEDISTPMLSNHMYLSCYGKSSPTSSAQYFCLR